MVRTDNCTTAMFCARLRYSASVRTTAFRRATESSGLRTCLAAMRATGHSAWAALSTSGLRALDLPGSVCEVIVLADGDDPGEKAARAAAMRWSREGRRVRIARPPRGMDFNDMLLRRPPCIEDEHNER